MERAAERLLRAADFSGGPAACTRAGSVEWLCFPRFDSPSVFARLLDDEAGHWSVRPAGEHQVTRR